MVLGKNLNNTLAVLLVTVAGFVGFIPLMILPLLVSSYTHTGFSQSLAGLVGTAQLLGVAVGILLLSQSLIRYGYAKAVAVAAVLIVLIELLSLGFEATLATFVFRFLSGLGAGVITGCTYSWLAGQKHPDKGFGVFLLVQFIIGSCLLYILPSLVNEHGVVILSFTFLGFAFLALLLSGVFVNRPSGVNAEDMEEHVRSVPLLSMISNRRSLYALIALGLFELSMAGIWAYAEVIGNWLEIAPLLVSKSLAASARAGIPGAFVVVILGGRLGRRVPIYFGISVIAVSLLALTLGVRTAAVFVLLMMLFNGAWAFTVPYMQGIQAQIGRSGSLVCLGAFVVMLSLSLGPAIIGLLMALGGLVGAIYGTLLLLVFSLLLIHMVGGRRP